jgi:hypothetical protein
LGLLHCLQLILDRTALAIASDRTKRRIKLSVDGIWRRRTALLIESGSCTGPYQALITMSGLSAAIFGAPICCMIAGGML